MNIQVLREKLLQPVKLLSIACKIFLQVVACNRKDHLTVEGILVAFDHDLFRFDETVGIILFPEEGDTGLKGNILALVRAALGTAVRHLPDNETPVSHPPFKRDAPFHSQARTFQHLGGTDLAGSGVTGFQVAQRLSTLDHLISSLAGHADRFEADAVTPVNRDIDGEQVSDFLASKPCQGEDTESNIQRISTRFTLHTAV